MPIMTITTTAGQAQRYAAAVGRALKLGRDGTAQECKDYTVRMMRDVVLHAERQLAQEQLAPPASFDPT